MAAVIDVPSRYVGQEFSVSLELHDDDAGTTVQVRGHSGQLEGMRIQQLTRANPPNLPGVYLPESIFSRVQVTLGFPTGLPLTPSRMYWLADADRWPAPEELACQLLRPRAVSATGLWRPSGAGRHPDSPHGHVTDVRRWHQPLDPADLTLLTGVEDQVLESSLHVGISGVGWSITHSCLPPQDRTALRGDPLEQLHTVRRPRQGGVLVPDALGCRR